MNQGITFHSYLSRIGVIALLYLTLPILFLGWASATTSSYSASALCFYVLLLISIKLILKEKKYIKFYSVAFVVQLLIGLVHYLYFVDPNYFQTNGDASGKFWHEYLSVFDAIDRLQDARRDWGIFYWMDAREFEVAHPEIWHIISLPFYYLSHRWLNYAPLNTFSSLLASVNIMFLYKREYKENKAIHDLILFWTAFFPTFLLNDTVWRDPFGICLISIGVVLVALSNNFVSKVVSFVIFGFASFVQRTMYVLIAAAAATWESIQKSRNVVLRIFYVAVGCVLLFYLSNLTDETNGAEYNAGYVNSMSYLALPIKIIFGMIGPFPWTNFFRAVEMNPAFAWQLQDYIMGTFQLGYLLAIIMKWQRFSFKNLNAITIMGFGIMLSGFISKQMHIGYISEGLLFTLPWFFSYIGNGYRKYLSISFTALIILNVLLFFMGNLGIAFLWK